MAKIFWKYIKSRLPVLLIALCIVSGMIASAGYAKYVADEEEEASFDVVAQPELTLNVSAPDANGNYTIANAASNNLPTYIRFTVVANWVSNTNGQVWFLQPVEGVDYRINTSCTQIDDYYYYNGEVGAGTGFQVNVSPIVQKDSYTLQIEILAESIQSVPTTVVEGAWGVTFNGSTWSKQ